MIGASGDDDKGIESGSAYVFTRDSNGGWSQTKKLTADDGEAGDSFGYSVAVNGNTAVVGAYQDDREDDTTIDSGSAYVFTWDSDNNAWDDGEKLTAADGDALDYFGYSVAVDVDTVVVGAYGDDDNGSASGSAYVFTRDFNGKWIQTKKLTDEDGVAGDWFGYSVAVDTAAHTALVGAGSAHVLDIHDWEEVPGIGGQLLTEHTVENLFNGREYDFQVRAVNLRSPGPQAKEEAVPRAPTPTRDETPALVVNRKPIFDGDSAMLAVPENTAVGGNVGNVRAIDPENDTLVYSLSGTDASNFNIDVSTSQVTVGSGTELDYESGATSYSLIVSVHDGRSEVGTAYFGIDASIPVTVNVTDVDEPPSQPAAPEVSRAGRTGLAVAWAAPDNQGPEITDYDVRYREGGGEFRDAGYNGTSTSVALDGLMLGTRYEVQVRAINAEGISPWSESGQGETGEALPTPEPGQTPAPGLTPEAGTGPAGTPVPTAAPAAGPTATVTPDHTGTPVPTPTPEPVAAPTTVPAAALTQEPTETPGLASTDGPTPAPAPTMEPMPSEADSEGGGFPWWIIAAVVIGVVAGVLLIIVLLLSLRRARRNRRGMRRNWR